MYLGINLGLLLRELLVELLNSNSHVLQVPFHRFTDINDLAL